MSQPLSEIAFESVLVDRYGNLTERRRLHAEYYALPIQAEYLEMIRIPGGSFLMGASIGEVGQRANERPQHEVTLAPFFLSRYPITQSQWSAVMPSLPPMQREFQGDNLPVVNVWLEHAVEFCRRLSEVGGQLYRLPSEAEWEYACRAGTTSPFHCGHTLTADLANFNARQGYDDGPVGEHRRGLTPVGYFGTANQFGLSDLHGNVWEWCADEWHEDYEGAPADGGVWIGGGDPGYRVQRGGSWRDGAIRCRSAFRVGDIAHNADHIVGLRVCAPA